MPLSPMEMIRLLKNNGFVEVSQNGSHKKMYHPVTKVTVIVPYHSKELKKGLEQAILKQAGIKKS
ncbi:MAG: type II toxin-antitoxin system HicA family toxin [Lachnospiraceae bacterium]|nr:type II toxin-antitoxin system HicA family toxin [Lachnospiraceae bacterium]